MNRKNKKKTIEYMNKYKKAQFFTDTKLVMELVKNFSININNKTILEPSCGDCSFVEYLYNNSCNSSITAIDIDKKYIERNKKKFANVNFITDDFLGINLTSKFDLVIGNPPFNLKTKYNYKDTTEGFIFKGLEILNNNGLLVMILPSTVLRNMQYQNLRKNIIENYKIEYIMDTSNYDFLGMDFETIALCVRAKKVKNQRYIYIRNDNKQVKVDWVKNKRFTIHIDNLNGIEIINNRLGSQTISDVFDIYRGNSLNEKGIRGRDINFFANSLSANGNDYFIGIQNIAYRFAANVIKGEVSNVKDTVTILYPKKNIKINNLLYYVEFLNSSVANYIIHECTLNNCRLTIHMDKYYIDDIKLPTLEKVDKVLDDLRNLQGNVKIAQERNKKFYKILNLDSSLINQIEKTWSVPRYIKKNMEKV